MSPGSCWRSHTFALVAYVGVALAFAWPLPLHLGTHLTGARNGDTDVYVWNLWVFQHEVLGHHSLPYFTDTIFSLSRTRANLSLHNYTAFQNLIALPLVGSIGLIESFNVIYLLMGLITAYVTFLLAKHVTGRAVEAWLAGLLFAWSPVLVTRGAGHFSLVAAAPLALFMLLLLRTATSPRLRDAVALGATVWWAASTDVYYAVYCILMAAVYLAARRLTVERRLPEPAARAVPWALDVFLLSVGGLVMSLLISKGWQFTFLGIRVGIRSLYTPMLVLTLLAVVRVGWRYRLSVVKVQEWVAWRIFRFVSVATAIAVVLLSPVLYALGARLRYGGFESPRTFWRSSPPGVDLVSLILPNPNHAFAPAWLREWLSFRPNGYLENVASLTFVTLIAIALAWRTGWRPPRLWTLFALIFGALALGPFIHIAGVNTYVPGPWALLRYVPVIGLARTPARFSVALMLAVAVLFASALCWLGQRWPKRRALLLGGATVLVLFELLPAPRTLYSAAVPRIYERVAADPSHVRLLELPFGVRDGASSHGNFTGRSQLFQTVHGKPLIGGYLSRVSKRRIARIRQYEILDALIGLSEGQPITALREVQLLEQAPRFVEQAALGYVVIDRSRAADALREFAIRVLRLEFIESDGVFELYRPAAYTPS